MEPEDYEIEISDLRAEVAELKRQRPIYGHLSEVMKIIEGARTGDMQRVAAYTELLAEKLVADGEPDSAKRLLQVLRGEGGYVYSAPAGLGSKVG